MPSYGKELILDLFDCDATLFKRDSITLFFEGLCELLEMKRCDMHFWDDVGVPEDEKQTDPHLKGTSAIQFILTSNITIHTLDILRTVHLNIFSCKDFDTKGAIEFCIEFFNGQVKRKLVTKRG